MFTTQSRGRSPKRQMPVNTNGWKSSKKPPEMVFPLLTSTRATELACDIRIHRSILLPPNPDIGREKSIRVSYSDVGYSSVSSGLGESRQSSGGEVPVILWASGMFGGRYQAFAVDEICQKHRVRFLAIDRPGIGGTDAVRLDQRVGTWLDLVPELLRHLGIKHVHLAAHSAGMIYILNTLLHQRHLLHPVRPIVTVFGPWVQPSKSGKWGLTAVGYLPQIAIGTWHFWAKLMNNYIAPVITASGLSVTRVPRVSADVISDAVISKDSTGEDVEGTKTTWRKASEAVMTRYIYAEDVSGGSQEAMFCLRKGGVTWGQWQDTDEAILQIAERERARRHESGRTETDSAHKINLRIYFAEEDEMIGEGGQKWLEQCFAQEGVADSMQVESEVVPGTDHNDILASQYKAMEKMIQTVGQSTRDA
jgi:pimeloyl-ACP methyl ester carboxylesterase